MNDRPPRRGEGRGPTGPGREARRRRDQSTSPSPRRRLPSGVEVRRAAIDALVRVDAEGAYANLVLPRMLDRSPLDQRDRALVTELVYGTTRMQRACDFLVERFLLDTVDPSVRAALRVGAYQLAFAGIPPHAAVGTTAGAVPARVRGLVNAVLRRVAEHPVGPDGWPSDAVRLSYPDWLVERLVTDLGADTAIATLERMNQAPITSTRADGYVQDLGSQLVIAAVGAGPGELVADVCAAPGGKATGLSATGALVVASDLRAGRMMLVESNRGRVDATSLELVVADGTKLPYRDATFDRVLVDAPCSGLGSLRRRPDARWRIEPDAIDRLAALQVRLLREAARVVRPGGHVFYSVCTFTTAETLAVDEQMHTDQRWLEQLRGDHLPESSIPGLPTAALSIDPTPLPEPWQPHGRGHHLLPHESDTDGMCVFRYTRQ
jgi:16S rRNA (cytosine967-C5)-methyltransferase